MFYMDSLPERVHKIKEEVLGLKASQASQNDSYQFYLYRTDNLYVANSTQIYKIQFLPEAKTQDQVICMFRDFDMLANGSTGYCSPNDPLTYYFTRQSYTTPPMSERKVYVTCISNCKGQLIVEEL